MLILLSPEPHSEDQTLSTSARPICLGVATRQTHGPETWTGGRGGGGGSALIMGSLIGFGACGQAQRGRARTRGLQIHRDSMDAYAREKE